ncbi:MAG: hypothetical protein AAF401_03070 [Pseudomonadota bacterium]
MRRVFLGKPLHWLLACLLIGGGFLLGLRRLHVTDFNLFLIALIIATVVMLAIVLATSKGEGLTRDPIPTPQDDEENGA